MELDYWQYLNRITESPEEYLLRRDSFLNHLLARFSEHFSEYVLLMFALNGQKHDLQKTVQDKSHFLYHYPEISRNRGRAFNYTNKLSLWNTDNISGFERKVTAMMGIPDFNRQNLNNFRVKESNGIYYYRLFYKGSMVLLGKFAYKTKSDAENNLEEIFHLARDKSKYTNVDCPISGTYTFKIVSNKNNIAIHPGTYPNQKIRDEMIETLTENLELRIYQEITTADPNIPMDPDINQPTGLVTEPFEYTGNVFVKFRECVKLSEDLSYRYQIIDEDEVCAIHPAIHSKSDIESVEEKLKKSLKDLDQQYSNICFGEHRAVVQLEGRYHYQLVQVKSKEESIVLWRSYESFSTAQLALEAFEKEFFTLIELARKEQNYIKKEVAEKETYFLASGEDTFLAILPIEEINEDLTAAKRLRLEHAQRFPVFHTEKGFGFRLIQLDSDLKIIGKGNWVGTEWFDSPREAWTGFHNCLELICNDKNWFWTEIGDDRYQLAVGELLLESDSNYFSDYSAWEGTKEFTEQFKEEDNLDIFIDFWDECSYSFRVVDQDYRLAVHPYSYNSSEEREVVLNCLRKNAMERESFFQLVSPKIDFKKNENATKCYYFTILGESDEKLWQGYHYYSSEKEAKEAYEEQFITIMNLARKAENYHLKVIQKECRVMLCNEKQEIVAIIPQVFSPDYNSNFRLEEIVKRIKLARLFPIKQVGVGYKFDIYAPYFNRKELIEHAWEIITGSSDTDFCSQTKPIEPLKTGDENDCSEEEKLHLVKCIDNWISGDIILESVKTYTSREEIIDVVRWLKDHQYLFRQIGGYQPSQIEPCGPYSIEFVNPARILAVSPSHFTTYSECSNAVQRTDTKVNAEGFHLVEHLLLRPVKKIADKYIHQIKDTEGNVILYGLKEYEDDGVAKSHKSNFINQVKKASEILLNQWRQKQVHDYEWQEKIRIYEDQQLIAVGCDLQLSEEVFLSQIKYLTTLNPKYVSHCHLREKECDDSLIKVCIDPKDCKIPDNGNTTVSRCGNTLDIDDNIFEDYIHGADPYSFWTTIVIPYWPGRFQNANFRAFFSNTIRRELPAYIAPRILWANPKEMQVFEQAFRAWIRAKSNLENLKDEHWKGTADSDQGSGNCLDLQLIDIQPNTSMLDQATDELDVAQRALIQILFSLNSEYKIAQFEGISGSDGEIVQLNEAKLA